MFNNRADRVAPEYCLPSSFHIYLWVFVGVLKMDIKKYLLEEKNKFLDEKYLDWHVATYIRNYPEFLEMDHQKAIELAKNSFQDDLPFLTEYISDINQAYEKAKTYLEINPVGEDQVAKKLLGFVLIHPTKEDFVAGLQTSEMMNVVGYGANPEAAKVFNNFDEIENFVSDLEDFTFDIAKLYDSGKNFEVEYETSVSSQPIE